MTPPSAETNGPSTPADEDISFHRRSVSARDLLLRLGTIACFLAFVAIWLVNRYGLEAVLTDLWSWTLVAIGLGLVIFIHELGHFAVAKWCDVHVETFSIGFGPAIPGCSFRWGETLYKIAWFPLGGYVKMVGEGVEAEEDDTDPRSFKNKAVWQRMAIISAGVIMNVLLGFVCFIIVFMHGVERQPAEVMALDSGAVAWKKGIPSGATIVQIDGIHNPNFEDLKFAVVLSQEGHPLVLVYESPEHPGQLVTIEVEPRRSKDDLMPLIGITTPYELQLPEKPRNDLPLVRANTPAAAAEPPFQFGDTIVGTTDSEQLDHPDQPYRPDKVKLLPLDPRNKEKPDYFEYRRRLDRLAGKPMVMQVRRRGAAANEPPVNISVGPASHYTFGMRMRIGRITAIRDDSPASKARNLSGGEAGVRARNLAKGVEGDILKQVEVMEANGTKTRFVNAADAKSRDGVTVKPLDPLRLPYELEAWASRHPGKKKVILTVSRLVEHADKDVQLEADWDSRWRVANEMPISTQSPLSLPEIGLAYQVDTFIDAVEPSSPAEMAGLQPKDLIKAVRFQKVNNKPGEWNEVESDQWASIFSALQFVESKEITVRLERDNLEVTLTARPDDTWPLLERGLILGPETRIQKAGSLGEAIGLGMQQTSRTIKRIYLNLRALLTGRISFKTTGGPIMIARVAYLQASEGIFPLILFLGMISINLAVINFLPIPVLDGGHMVFLIYEKITGAPASETARIYLTYAGLILILTLMVLVFWLDITKL